MQQVEFGYMVPQTVTAACQCPAEPSSQKQAEGAVWSPLMEEGQSAAEAATQGKLTLEQEQRQASAITTLN